MAIRTSLVNGRELKTGDTYMVPGEAASFAKIVSISVSKPGKHGAAKNIITAKNIVNNKTISCTFKDTDERLHQVDDFDYIHKVVYSLNETEIITNQVVEESLHVGKFADQERFKEAIKAVGEKYTDSNGNVLCIKYTDMGDEKGTLVFWEFVYIGVDDLPRNGIADYCP
ncbi:hypothetical protein ENBRE01_1181 [Enteropsectra breve]|nr:hypothetical protein ENBRE01_1181 [Enteropsectra breve]